MQKILRYAFAATGLRRLGPTQTPWQASVRFVNRPKMARLNYQYRRKKYPTDVLSFPSFGPFRKAGILGEIVICLPVLKAQALRSHKFGPELELDVLLVHGLLHLLGLDHERNAQEARKMSRWELYLLNKLKAPTSDLGLIDRSIAKV